MTTIVAPCSGKCQNSYQDEKYGSGMRVMNQKQGKVAGFNCTVCATVN